MNLYEILIPTISNDGKPFRTRHHKVWDKKVLEIASGLTIMSPTTSGTWTSKCGKTFVERTIPVRIFCNDVQISLIADWTAKHYKQLAVMYYRISDSVTIKHYQV